MVLPIDNMSGGQGEIKKVQKFLEEGMKEHFQKLSIPASWLVLSLCLRKREERAATLQSVLELAKKLGIPEEEAKLALWFLHHYAGALMYFPNLPELQDTVICDTQIVYDSATNLIVNTFKFGRVSVAASEKFRKKGQFSLGEIRGATAGVSGDYIPLQKLVKLLEHLNIIAALSPPLPPPPPPPPSTPSASTSQSLEVTYFMPCVLQSCTHEQLNQWLDSPSESGPLSPAPLFVRYRCGFVPIGVFTAMIANLATQKSLHMIYEGIKKNRVQFRFGRDFETVTLISQPKFYAAHVLGKAKSQTASQELCSSLRGLLESTLGVVTSHMNYSFHMEYQLSFECPSHPGREHLCIVDADAVSPRFMLCLANMEDQEPLEMQSQHLVWFGKVSPQTDSTADTDSDSESQFSGTEIYM